MNVSRLSIGQSDQLPSQLVRNQLAIVCQYGFIYLWMHLIAASLLCAMLWAKAPVSLTLVLIWYSAVILLAISLALINSRLADRRAANHPKFMDNLQQQRFLNTILSTLWGISGIILFNEEVLGLAIHLTLLLIISISILPSLIVSRQDFYVQLAVLLIPIVLMLLIQDGIKFRLLGITVAGFGGVMLLAGHIFTRMLDNLLSTQQTLVEQVHTDPITQLINRSHFDQVFKTEWRRAARHQLPISLLMIEIDDFQQLEIRQGQTSTDQYLRAVTHCLKTVARRGSDLLARYGRSEFVLLMPGSSSEEAMSLAIRLRDEVARAKLEYIGKQESIVSVSIGVSSCSPRTSPEDIADNPYRNDDELIYPAMLLSAADRALQRAKQLGLERIEYFPCGDDHLPVRTLYQRKKSQQDFSPELDPR